MKKLILLLLLIPSLAWGQVSTSGVSLSGCSSGGASAAAPSTFCASATATQSTSGGILCEDFEGNQTCVAEGATNCRVTWITAESPDYAFTGTGKVDGTYSIELNNTSAAESSRYDWGNATGDARWGYFKAYIVALPASGARSIVQWTTTGARIEYQINTDGTIRALHGAASDKSALSISAGNTYYFWFYGKAETAATNDGEAYFCFSSTTTKPNPATDTDYCAIVTTGTSEGTYDSIRFTNGFSTTYNVVIIDNIFIDDQDITGVP